MRKLLLCAVGMCVVAGCSKQGGDAGAAATPAAEVVSVASPIPAQVAQVTPTPHKRLLVLATIAPIYCFTKNVVGDLADVEMIEPEGAAWVGYKPDDAEMTRIMEADVVIENGFGYEDWMDRIEAHGLKPGAIRVLASRGTGPGIPGLPGDPNTPPAPPPDPTGAPPDPHVWLDPFLAIKEVQNIRDGLMARDPVNATQYLANENRYEGALRDLDDLVGRMTVDIPKRKIWNMDRTFSYFLSRYEFEDAPSNKADAVVEIKGAAYNQMLPTGMRIIQLDPMEHGPAATDYYETATTANAQALRDALMPAAPMPAAPMPAAPMPAAPVPAAPKP